jgi:hypothetical protein
MYDWSLLNVERRGLLKQVVRKWKRLVENKELDELAYHKFLEDHAGLFFSNPMGTYIVISNLQLGADFKPDLVVVSDNESYGFRYELIELESPHERRFIRIGFRHMTDTEHIELQLLEIIVPARTEGRNLSLPTLYNDLVRTNAALGNMAMSLAHERIIAALVDLLEKGCIRIRHYLPGGESIRRQGSETIELFYRGPFTCTENFRRHSRCWTRWVGKTSAASSSVTTYRKRSWR